MHQEIKIMRDKGMTWKEVAKTMKVSISTAKRRYKEAPQYPIEWSARIHKHVINKRMIMVMLDDGRVVPAIKKMGLNFPRGQYVKVEQIDEKHFRVV